MTGGPGKEQGTNKPPSTGRVQERWKGDTICPTTSQNPFHWHPSWLNKACTTRKDSESEWLAKDNLETSPITIKPKTVQATWQSRSPGFPYPTALPPGALSQENLLLCHTCVSSDNSFLSVRQEPSFIPWKGSAFLQQAYFSPVSLFAWQSLIKPFFSTSLKTLSPKIDLVSWYRGLIWLHNQNYTLSTL